MESTYQRLLTADEKLARFAALLSVTAVLLGAVKTYEENNDAIRAEAAAQEYHAEHKYKAESTLQQVASGHEDERDKALEFTGLMIVMGCGLAMANYYSRPYDS